MKFKEELLKIQSLDRNEEGDRIEPEEKPAEKITTMDMQAMGTLGAMPGTVASAITEQRTVGHFAQEIRRKCGGCKHFDLGSWQKMKLKMERSLNKDDGIALSTMRRTLVGTGNAATNDADVENALNFLGICHAYTEYRTGQLGRHEDVIVHPESSCPPNEPLFYEPQGGDALKAIDQGYDQIMRHAQGES